MENLLEVTDLKTYFPIRAGFFKKVATYVRAVDGISFSLKEEETLALVGESGCGKSTVGRTLLHLVPLEDGEIVFEGQDMAELNHKEVNKIRIHMQMIFQNPMSSLNPRMTVQELLVDGPIYHKMVNRRQSKKLALKLLDYVGLHKKHLQRFPHEFSGGQRQRICIARALSMNPKLLICDESVSALDVSIQAQILNLFKDLQEELKVAYLFISHDLGTVRFISDRVAVMYLGKIVEIAKTDELFNNPRHPYTKALLSAVPIDSPEKVKQRILLEGDIPSPTKIFEGCSFAERCPEVLPACRHTIPSLKMITSDHEVSCIHFQGEE